MTPWLSIVVPTWNEASELPGLLESLQAVKSSGAEVIVVDGGSTDGTIAIAEGAGCPTVRARKGRAGQMNAGAGRATGRTLLFLHADTRLPSDALEAIAAALADGRNVWGRFDVRFEAKRPTLRMVAWMMNGRSRLTGIATGDQAMFATRTAFEAAGGFPAQPLMEDVEMSRRLLRISPPACLRQCVTTSARRWESRGVWRTVLLMWRLRFDYWRGVPAQALADRYQ